MSLWEARAPELWWLILALLSNVESRTRAAVLGWAQPTSRTEMVLMDLFDLQVRSTFKPPHVPYPRPWDKQKTRQVKKRTAAQALAILRPNRRTDG